MVWSNFFLMDVFFALKGSKLFIIIYRVTDVTLIAKTAVCPIFLRINPYKPGGLFMGHRKTE